MTIKPKRRRRCHGSGAGIPQKISQTTAPTANPWLCARVEDFELEGLGFLARTLGQEVGRRSHDGTSRPWMAVAPEDSTPRPKSNQQQRNDTWTQANANKDKASPAPVCA